MELLEHGGDTALPSVVPHDEPCRSSLDSLYSCLVGFVGMVPHCGGVLYLGTDEAFIAQLLDVSGTAIYVPPKKGCGVICLLSHGVNVWSPLVADIIGYIVCSLPCSEVIHEIRQLYGGHPGEYIGMMVMPISSGFGMS